MATAREQLAQFAAGSKALGKLCREYKNRSATVHLEELVGGALSFYAAAALEKTGGVHLFVAEDRDAAAYLMNDFYNLLDETQVYFFPSSWKRSAAYGAEDAQGVVQRTATMNAVRGFAGKDYLVVCTYPEALAERVADAETLQQGTIAVRVGDKISIEVLEQALVDAAGGSMTPISCSGGSTTCAARRWRTWSIPKRSIRCSRAATVCWPTWPDAAFLPCGTICPSGLRKRA